MKILFACRGNVARSQIAAALFTKYSGRPASSAGINVFENENQKLNEIPLAEPVIRFMKHEGVDISNNIRKQLTPEMLENFDEIIVMSEPETIPDYLSNNKKVKFWDISDPKGMDDAGYIQMINQIKDEVKKAIDELK